MKSVVGLWGLLLSVFSICNLYAQVDTSYVFKKGTPFGTLDIRIAKSSTRYYYLQENRTFSFRENGGSKTNSYYDMTTWDSSPYTQGNLREKAGSNDFFIMNYRLLLPVAYKASYAEGYPMIVMLHGAGERGNCWNSSCHHADKSWKPNTNTPPAPTSSNSKLLNNDHNLLHGGKVYLDARNLAGSRLPNDPAMPGRAFPGFVLFPQNLNGWDTNSVQDAIRLIRLVAKKYNIDEDRIYIHGLSNGGGAVYNALKRAPWLFAAAVTFSAADDGGLTNHNMWPAVAHIPLWTFQGGQDTNPTPRETEGYVKRYRDAGGIARHTVYPELGHGTWNNAYKEADFFKWLLSKKKSSLHTYAGGNAICTTNDQGVRMEVAKGFRAYEWQKNGVKISGATSATYVANTTGSYRVRFSRVANPKAADWNEWSPVISVTQQTPAQPVIEQVGTVKLKDLNNYNKAHLKASKEAAHYYWYKNGSLVNLSGSVDDTVRHPAFVAGNCTGTCTGNGAYTLVTATADNCPSPPSKPKNIYFNNQAPVNIAAPGSFTGQVSSLSTVKLNWSDASGNETGFEIWRRNAVGTSYSKWEMRTLTAANVKTFTDTGLKPSTKYHYKIRAVSNTGRSNYTPAASNAFLTITTGEDNTKPSAPQSFTAKAVAINTIQLSWKASTDNTGIKQYRIYYGSKSVATGSPSTTHVIDDLTLNTNYSFTVKAEDFGGNLSAASNTASANTYVTGLYYQHTTGAWVDLDQINWSAAPEYTGTVSTFTIAPRTQEDYFNFQFDGYLYLTKSGVYQFRTISSDGSRVTVDNVVVVNNDGLHDNRTIQGQTISLNAGHHKINVKYFDYEGIHTLNVQYKGPDTAGKWVTIPASALRSGNSQNATMMASETNAREREGTFTENVHLNIYPNPATRENINLTVESYENIPVEVILMDFHGKEVYRRHFETAELAYGTPIVPDGTLNEGIYIFILKSGDNAIRERIWIKN